MAGLVIRWHAKVVPHHNLVVIHTRGEKVQDYLDLFPTARRDGSSFVIEADHKDRVVSQLLQEGFIVE